MSRLARIMGLGGVAALGAGLFLTAPAHAQSPTPSLTIPDAFGITCTNDEANHQILFRIDLGAPATVSTDISDVSVSINGTDAPTVAFSPDPIDVGQDSASATVIATPNQINTIEAQATITPEGGSPVVLDLPAGSTAAPCAGGTTTTSSSSTSSTSSSSTTSTTAGSTTSTSAGATTTSTSTTLGPNDTTGTLTVSPSTIAAGGTLAVAGIGFAPNADITITLFSDPVVLGTIKSNVAGGIAGNVVVPANTAAGAHKVEAKGANAAGNGINLLRADLTVRASSGTIPRTGGSSDFLLPVGIAVVSLGILAFAWRERRLS